jgi:hypothetical protein
MKKNVFVGGGNLFALFELSNENAVDIERMREEENMEKKINFFPLTWN